MKVILPGSYDPVTVGHLDMIRRAAEAYDEVYAVIFQNPNKKYLFTLRERVSMLMLATEELDNVLVSSSDGLVIDYMRDHGIELIIKGYRNESDIEWEREQAEWNLKHGGYETELWKCSDGMSEVSSTAVRRALTDGVIPTELLPPAVAGYIERIKK